VALAAAGEAFIVPTQVNYVGKGAPIFEVLRLLALLVQKYK
jgi:hypothetical protein